MVISFQIYGKHKIKHRFQFMVTKIQKKKKQQILLLLFLKKHQVKLGEYVSAV